jgi:hypothetical protein
MKNTVPPESPRFCQHVIDHLLYHAAILERRAKDLSDCGQLGNVQDRNLKVALAFVHDEHQFPAEMARLYRLAARFFISKNPGDMDSEANSILVPEPSSFESDQQERLAQKREEYMRSKNVNSENDSQAEIEVLTDFLCAAVELMIDFDIHNAKSKIHEFRALSLAS